MSFLKNLFKEQVSAAPEAHATIDQASEHSKPPKADHAEFSLDVQEQPPTEDQLTNILDYLGPGRADTVVKDASGANDALQKFRKSAQTFQAPVVVDWSNGKAEVMIQMNTKLETSRLKTHRRRM
ncbi:hypothetical protein AMS68_006274 [Peltaster fructicola]|uniref:Uncharacterized protein n=1 Tax=Peltaster fructicola TaxID=286661 RepID=A0A6H0Y170_9PEZI|nr:hypothetical protein AMS68_006274 [Peltaster fructicola]